MCLLFYFYQNLTDCKNVSLMLSVQILKEECKGVYVQKQQQFVQTQWEMLRLVGKRVINLRRAVRMVFLMWEMCQSDLKL